MILTPGGNSPVPTKKLHIRVLSGAPVDASAFRLFDHAKVHGDADMVFYGQTTNDDSTVQLLNEGNTTTFIVDVARLKPDVQKIAFTVACDNNQTIAGLQRLAIQVEADQEVLVIGTVELAGRQEAALILGELYLRNNEWKFRFISQGFNGGLQPLAEHFGVDVSEPAPTPTPTPTAVPTPAPAPAPAPSTISLSKVSLSKEKPSISLAKQDSFGEIRINLNWKSHSGEAPTGFFKRFSANKGIDLDLGAFVELQNGYKTVIQALGNSFGSYPSEPYVELQGDDRTGAVTEGEWLHINGREWKNIKQVLVYAFIYEGAPSWEKTEGVVTLYVPGQPPIETRLTEGDNKRTLCAIARLVNEGGSIKVERINRFYRGQNEMDSDFDWGFSWTSGSK